MTKSIDAPHKAQAWLTETQAAARLNMSVKWLQKCRLAGVPPTYAKFGSAVRYSVATIEAFEASCVRTSTSDPGPRLGRDPS